MRHTERKRQIDIYLETARRRYNDLLKAYNLGHNTLVELPLAEVAECISHLRDSLDYAFQDICDIYVRPGLGANDKLKATLRTKVHFPHNNQTEASFKGHPIISRIKDPKVLALLKGVQPFSGDKTIHFLSMLSNKIKHDIQQQEYALGKKVAFGQGPGGQDFINLMYGDQHLTIVGQSNIPFKPCVPLPGGVIINGASDIELAYWKVPFLYISNSSRIRIHDMWIVDELTCHNSEQVSLHNNYFNEPLIHQEYDHIYLINGEEMTEYFQGVEKPFDPASFNFVHTDITNFQFTYNNEDVLKLLRHSAEKVRSFIDDLYKILP